MSLKASRPLFWMALSTLLISGVSWGAWGLYGVWKERQAQDSRYLLQAILVKSLSEDRVPPAMIAEWLNLSVKRPINLYAFPLKLAQKRIEAQAPVKRATVSIVWPSTLQVEIELRRPVALIGNRTNTAIDEEGVVFPLVPFYTPKRLPLLFLGEGSHFLLAKEILNACPEPVLALDLEKCEASSCGEREIVLTLGQTHGQTFIRLDPDRWRDGIDKLFQMKYKSAKVVDMRIPHMAIVLP